MEKETVRLYRNSKKQLLMSLATGYIHVDA